MFLRGLITLTEKPDSNRWQDQGSRVMVRGVVQISVSDDLEWNSELSSQNLNSGGVINTLLSCIYFYSFLNGVDPQITQAVIKVESNGNTFALSPDRKDSGLMQIRHKYVPETMAQLFNPCTNVKRGTELLKQAMTKCKHQADMTWIICFNTGLAGGKRIKFPRKFPYYKKVIGAL